MLFGGVLIIFVYPSLDNFTGGSLTERFRDLDTTGRLETAIVDMQIFSENLILGVGVGRSTEYHNTIRGISLAAHTEFTRLLAEHGLLGLLIIALMIGMLARRYEANQPGLGRGLTAALAVWAISIMFHSAMRLAVIPLAIALALVCWRLQQTSIASETDMSAADVAIANQPFTEQVMTRHGS